MITVTEEAVKSWMHNVIKREQYEKFMEGGKDFINDEEIWEKLKENSKPEPSKVRDIIAKALSLERLEPDETATLLNVEDKELWQEIFEAAGKIKEKVYGKRIVTFAPLYVSNYCVNDCEYCGYRISNKHIKRKQLTEEELKAEVEALVKQGHKRLIMVYGEHPSSDARFIAKTLEITYGIKIEGGEIRRVNVNAAPMSIEDLELLRDIGIGTYQVFQETYHHETYKRLHKGIKADYHWRLYSLHRAMEAGVDDVAIGALFGLYDWRFEVMGLLYHAIDLEKRFGGVGPHTISFPRLEPAVGTPFYEKNKKYIVSDEDFMKLVAVIRLSVPYTGMILTAREPKEVREKVLPLGVTQLDFGTNIGVGAYSKGAYSPEKQQFLINDERSLDEGIRWLAEKGLITSFCTAGYRCGRTGNYFMDIAKKGKVHKLCMPNAILTFKEYLLDYASEETRKVGEKLIEKELESLDPKIKGIIQDYLKRIEKGERDLYV
ncbi:biotin and thiamin synthesis associated [Desulfurobacterium thermolithotrophum DSM 11699]|uniref:Biotin and thiamin synthesis associated n=1 Tax=Desulfurobacterium thermolithotrophum (strain DSM 11699 / BSA) TaxID=868864 RepID=F0S0Z8_DESTD|nr:[FeFe] hydrogenase H-cluster radical SAM maturase HydG [Desulfurobacterium thermolithotrophum]ADY72802.1 biotin and thiamin synthesis associated [Desulfurobacterium thermolithotrophum DSM 11699]